MPKRKAAEEVAEAPPKTNRQIREEARARAREWAAKEQARKTTQKKNPAPTKPAVAPTAPIAKPVPAAKKLKLNSGKAAKPTKKEMIEEAKARAQAWAANLQVSKTTASTSSPKRVLKKAARTSATKTPKEESAKKPSKKAVDEEIESPDAATEHAQSTMTPEMQAALMRAHQEVIARAQMENAWAANNYFAQMAAMAPGAMAAGGQRMMSPQEVEMHRVQQQMTPGATTAGGSRMMSPQEVEMHSVQQQMTPGVIAAGGQHMMSPQEIEMHRVQQQVMENAGMGFMPWFNYTNMAPLPTNMAPLPTNMAPAQMNVVPRFASPPINVPPRARAASPAKTLPKPKVPPPPFVAQQAVIAPAEPQKEEHHSPIKQDDEVKERSNLSQWLAIGVPFLLLSIFVAVASTRAFIDVEEAFLLSLNESVHKEPFLPPCFHPSLPEEKEPLGICDHSKKWQPCPNRGVCSGGELRSCEGIYHDVSENRDQCILSADSNETLAKVEAALAKWTVEHTCKLQGCAHAIKNPDAKSPFFDISVVQAEVNTSETTLRDLLYHWPPDDIEVLSGNDDKVIMGLTDDYVEHKLVVPFSCYIGLWLVWFMDLVVKSFWFAAHWATGSVLKLTLAFPLASAIVYLVLWGIYAFRKRRHERQKLMQDVANVRQLTYAKLKEDVSKEHIVLHLRDEVAMDLYPTSKSNRAYIIHKVWPRVVADVKHDNRVLKANTVFQGTPRDVWQWTAFSTSKKHVDETN